MHARSTREKPMTDDSRIAKLEADVQRIQSDMSGTKSMFERLQESLESFRIEILREIGSFKTQVAREFGSVRTSIERTKLWMLMSGLGMIVSVWGAALALARFLKP